jgi:allophanate hydrolase
MVDAATTSNRQFRDGFGNLGVERLRQMYGAAAVDPVDVAKIVHERARARASANAWITLRDVDSLIADAEAVLRRWRDPADRPPLYGIPVAVKDNIDVEGVHTTAACPDFAYLASKSATVVQRLIDAGALIVGKTNMDQFATGLTGTRSPYGECTSPLAPHLVAGGSSSGSAVAVSTGLVSVALGTDTAGSGRVPAAFCNVVGVKPSRGLLSTQGLVPACRSLDCPSVFALSVADAWAAMRVMIGPDDADPWSRVFVNMGNAPKQRRIGVPTVSALGADVDATTLLAFDIAKKNLEMLGFELVGVDIDAFLAAGELLYEGPWVAERLAVLGEFVRVQPEAVFPVTREVLQNAFARWSAVDSFRGVHRLAELGLTTRRIVGEVDAVVFPTVPCHPSLDSARRRPHAVNAMLGRFTTFANLLDLAAVSVPIVVDGECPAGVTLYGAAGADAVLARIAGALHGLADPPLGATGDHLGESALVPADLFEPDPGAATALLAVVGAHRTGQPLNSELVELGGRYRQTTTTAAAYRFFALGGDGPARPGLLKDPEAGVPIEVELYELPVGALGQLLVSVPEPLGLGTIELIDGRRVVGFVCERYATSSARDISGFGSWPAFLGTAKKA